jgi:hypothetical protein
MPTIPATGERVTVTQAMQPAISKMIGTWEVYNVSPGMVHLCRIQKGKRAHLAEKNMLNISPAQFAEIKNAQE